MHTRSSVALGITALVLGAACGDPTEGTRQVVEVSFTSDGAAAPITLGANTLTITRAEFVVRRMRSGNRTWVVDIHDERVSVRLDCQFIAAGGRQEELLPEGAGAREREHCGPCDAE